MEKPLVGISTCLLGENVRYDGGHKLDRYLRDVLGRFVDYVPVCPEVECGLGVPREAIHLEEAGGSIRLVGRKSGTDRTPQMNRWIRKRLGELAGLPLCGFVFRAKSPSSGLYRIAVHRETGVTRDGTGLFAGAFTKAFPLLPVEEDGRLNDAGIRENFVERIFVMHRWHELCGGRRSMSGLMEFHAAHKYLIMAHCPGTLKRLGAFLAGAKGTPVAKVYDAYFEQFITALGRKATVRKTTNVLQHIEGYFKKDLTPDEKSELGELIEDYHRELVPLVVPVTMLNHYVRKYGREYLAKQVFLNPHPMELMLRNHV
jgi:uncharacterized protein YbgA (DUF1722 family)/uncharacterized protein YbbK (DUF523 family)